MEFSLCGGGQGACSRQAGISGLMIGTSQPSSSGGFWVSSVTPPVFQVLADFHDLRHLAVFGEIFACRHKKNQEAWCVAELVVGLWSKFHLIRAPKRAVSIPLCLCKIFCSCCKILTSPTPPPFFFLPDFLLPKQCAYQSLYCAMVWIIVRVHFPPKPNVPSMNRWNSLLCHFPAPIIVI